MSKNVSIVCGFPGVSSLDILAFMEYLTQSGMSPDHITNHITVVRSLYILYGYNIAPFRDEKICLLIKSLKLNPSFSPRNTIVMDETLLLQIVTVSAQLVSSCILAGIFLFSKAVKYIATFGYLCAGDVIFF